MAATGLVDSLQLWLAAKDPHKAETLLRRPSAFPSLKVYNSVLKLWIMIPSDPLGVRTTLPQGLSKTVCISYIYIMIHNGSKITVRKWLRNNFTVWGSHHTVRNCTKESHL